MSKLLHQMHPFNLHHKPVFVSQIAGKLGGTGLVSTQIQTESKTKQYICVLQKYYRNFNWQANSKSFSKFHQNTHDKIQQKTQMKP